MKDLIIDGNFEGLTQAGVYHVYDGTITYEGSIIIKVDLFVTGSIEAGEWIKKNDKVVELC